MRTFTSNSTVLTNLKGKIKSMKGIRHHRFGDVLDEFMYRYKFAVKSGDVYHNLLSDIAEFYKI